MAAPAWLGTAAPTRDEVYESIMARGALRVGMDASFPPFEFTGEQQMPEGLDVDLATALSQHMGLRVEFVTVGFDTLYPELAAGHFDLIISALPFDRTRTRDVAYSDIYFRDGEVLVLRADEGQIKALSDLKGQVVGVEFASSAETVARQAERRSGFQVRTFETLDAAARALEEGAIQAVVADAVSARLLRRAHASLRIAEQPVGDEPNYVVAMPINAPLLLAAVNRQLRAMDQDGSLKAILDRWL